MRKSVKIFCSSSLAFKSSIWNNLKNKFNFSFQEFIDLENFSVSSLQNDVNFIILIIEDLLKYRSSNQSSLIKALEKEILRITKKTSKKIVISVISQDSGNIMNFVKTEDPKKKFFYSLKTKIVKHVKNNENLFFFDLDSIFISVGYEKIFDSRNWYSFRLRLSQEGLKLITRNIEDLLEKIFTPSKKVLVLDCDNTLWGGVIGEDGLENLKLGSDGIGKAFQDFQIEIKSISDRGVLICLASKNNSNDVWEVFNKHPEMILKKKDITLASINWNDKSKNLISLSKKLNLSLDSFVFIDDNPLERELLKKSLPKVKTIDMPSDVSLWKNHLSKLDLFYNFQKTSEDMKKKKQYKQKLKFDIEIDRSSNKEKFLKNIKLKLKIEKLNKFHLTRASQMTMKTNQFNFTTRRYTIDELKILGKDKDHDIFILKANDKYGDHGYVSLIMMQKIDNKKYLINNFLTSCRILGRNIEKKFIDYIKEKLKKEDSLLFIEYIPSKRNKLVKDFLNKNNYKILNKKEKKILNLQTPSYIYKIN